MSCKIGNGWWKWCSAVHWISNLWSESEWEEPISCPLISFSFADKLPISPSLMWLSGTSKKSISGNFTAGWQHSLGFFFRATATCVPMRRRTRWRQLPAFPQGCYVQAAGGLSSCWSLPWPLHTRTHTYVISKSHIFTPRQHGMAQNEEQH